MHWTDSHMRWLELETEAIARRVAENNRRIAELKAEDAARRGHIRTPGIVCCCALCRDARNDGGIGEGAL